VCSRHIRSCTRRTRRRHTPTRSRRENRIIIVSYGLICDVLSSKDAHSVSLLLP
jgi:hypothetical protein